MSNRTAGYHYVTDKNGKKHRVYGPNTFPKPLSGGGAYMQGRNVSRAVAGLSAARALQGRGAYYDSKFVKTMNRYVPKGAFKTIGGVWGPLGAAAGAGLAKLAGFGSYHVKTNSILSEGQSPAAMHSSSNKMTVRHREYITDIVSSGSSNTFTNQAFPINPGLATSFPWLAAIGQQFEEYRIKGMVYEFKTLSADAISSSQSNMSIGGVIMATDYNAINANFVNKQQMDNTQYTTSCKPSESFYHPIECAPGNNPLSELYIRPGAVPSGSDQRMYDVGVFQIASFGVAATSVVLGELWCTYDVELSKPISTSALSQDVLSDHFTLSTAVAAHPLGTTHAQTAGSSLGGSINSGGTVYSFNSLIQEGSYLVVWQVCGGTSQACATPTVTLANCNVINGFWSSGTGINDANFVSTTGSTTVSVEEVMWIAIVQVTALNATITFSTNGTMPTSTPNGDLVVTQFNSNIINLSSKYSIKEIAQAKLEHFKNDESKIVINNKPVINQAPVINQTACDYDPHVTGCRCNDCLMKK